MLPEPKGQPVIDEAAGAAFFSPTGVLREASGFAPHSDVAAGVEQENSQDKALAAELRGHTKVLASDGLCRGFVSGFEFRVVQGLLPESTGVPILRT